MESEAAAAHRALVEVWARLYAKIDGARFERRGDLLFLLCPSFPIPQCNGPWVVEDTQAAADGLADAIAEVEASGARAWVQTRSGHERTQRAAAELGLTHREIEPGMVVRPDELAARPDDGFAIDLMAADEVDAVGAVLGGAFGAPNELTNAIVDAFARIEDAFCYVIRVDDEVVATAAGMTIDGVTGVFNVATLPEHRGRGLGAALTARVARDGFEAGATLAYLQSSEMGHGVYRQLGFRDVEEYILLTRPA